MIQSGYFTVRRMRIVSLSFLLVVQSFLLAGAAYAGEASLEKDGICVYLVQQGDTLSQIALELTGRVKNYPQLMDINRLDYASLSVGDTLFIPVEMLSESAVSACTFQELPASTYEPDKILADIEVLVFEDLNGDGQYDADESGVSGIEIPLPSTSFTVRPRQRQPVLACAHSSLPVSRVSAVTISSGNRCRARQ